MIKMNFMRDSKSIFGGSDEGLDMNKIQSGLKSIMKPEIDTKVGKAIELNNRIIHPIIQIIAIKNENQVFLTAEIFPIALVVEEPDDKYIISLTDREINPEELIEKISPKEKHEEAVIMLLRRISG